MRYDTELGTGLTNEQYNELFVSPQVKIGDTLCNVRMFIDNTNSARWCRLQRGKDGDVIGRLCDRSEDRGKIVFLAASVSEDDIEGYAVIEVTESRERFVRAKLAFPLWYLRTPRATVGCEMRGSKAEHLRHPVYHTDTLETAQHLFDFDLVCAAGEAEEQERRLLDERNKIAAKQQERQAAIAALPEPEQTLARMLSEHDWYYDYSDDSRVWQAGRDEYDRILKVASALPAGTIQRCWSDFAPKSCPCPTEEDCFA